MWKLIICKFILTCLAAYLIMTRQYFWDIGYYLNYENFRVMYIIMVPTLFIYMLVASIIYNIFLLYQPWSLNRWPAGERRAAFFLLSFLLIGILHIGQMDILFRMKGNTVLSSGYIYKDVFFFLVFWLAYLFFLYKRPRLSVFNIMIWSLFRGGLSIGMKNSEGANTAVPPSEDVVHGTITLPMAEEMQSQAVDNELRGLLANRVHVYKILLMYFSKNEPTYFVDTDGNKIFCDVTSSVTKGWKVSPWFVKINKNVYLNMWYFSKAEYSDATVLMEESVLKKAYQPIREWGGDLAALLKVSARCKKYVTQHFEHRDQLDSTGWDEYFNY